MIYRENRANIGLTQEEVAYMERNNHKLKAGVYCRVSTQLEIQEGSLAWQKQHYFELLSNDPNIESVQVYCDDGFSGKYLLAPKSNLNWFPSAAIAKAVALGTS